MGWVVVSVEARVSRFLSAEKRYRLTVPDTAGCLFQETAAALEICDTLVSIVAGVVVVGWPMRVRYRGSCAERTRGEQTGRFEGVAKDKKGAYRTRSSSFFLRGVAVKDSNACGPVSAAVVGRHAVVCHASCVMCQVLASGGGGVVHRLLLLLRSQAVDLRISQHTNSVLRVAGVAGGRSPLRARQPFSRV